MSEATYIEVDTVLPGGSVGTITKESDGTKTGARWRYPIQYRLVDGRVIDSTETRSRLRDAKAALGEPPRTYVGSRARLSVSLNDDGTLRSTRFSVATVDFLAALDRIREEEGG